MLNKILIFIFFISVHTLLAQKLDAVRIEVPSDIDAEQFHVESLGDNGMMIFYESNEVNKENKRKWYFGLFDTKLKQVWLKFLPLSDKIEFVKSKYVDGKVHLLFKNISRERFEYGFYDIVTYNIKKQTFTRVSGSLPLKSEVAGFEIISNTACIALNLKKHNIDLVFINLVNGDVVPVHIDEGTQGFIESLYAHKNANIFYVAIKQSRDRRYISDYILSFSSDGKELSETPITNTEALRYFREFVFVPQNSNELLIFGTYDFVTGRALSFKDVEEENEAKSAGLFFMKIVNGKQESLSYFDFMGFSNIGGAISPADISTVKLPDDTTKVDNMLVSASFSLSEPMVIKTKNNNYIFSVEAYRPYYKTETRMDYDFYGRPYPYTYNVFSGYKFFDVIVAGISPEGKMLWNNDFRIEDILTYSTKRNSVVFEDENYTTLAYVNNGFVISQTIEGDVDIDKSKLPIGTDMPQDRITQDENNHILKWYDDYFLIYGYQKLKNRTLGDKSTRVVFYANKIVYR